MGNAESLHFQTGDLYLDHFKTKIPEFKEQTLSLSKISQFLSSEQSNFRLDNNIESQAHILEKLFQLKKNELFNHLMLSNLQVSEYLTPEAVITTISYENTIKYFIVSADIVIPPPSEEEKEIQSATSISSFSKSSRKEEQRRYHQGNQILSITNALMGAHQKLDFVINKLYFACSLESQRYFAALWRPMVGINLQRVDGTLLLNDPVTKQQRMVPFIISVYSESCTISISESLTCNWEVPDLNHTLSNELHSKSTIPKQLKKLLKNNKDTALSVNFNKIQFREGKHHLNSPTASFIYANQRPILHLSDDLEISVHTMVIDHNLKMSGTVSKGSVASLKDYEITLNFTDVEFSIYCTAVSAMPFETIQKEYPKLLPSKIDGHVYKSLDITPLRLDNANVPEYFKNLLYKPVVVYSFNKHDHTRKTEMLMLTPSVSEHSCLKYTMQMFPQEVQWTQIKISLNKMELNSITNSTKLNEPVSSKPRANGDVGELLFDELLTTDSFELGSETREHVKSLLRDLDISTITSLLFADTMQFQLTFEMHHREEPEALDPVATAFMQNFKPKRSLKLTKERRHRKTKSQEVSKYTLIMSLDPQRRLATLEVLEKIQGEQGENSKRICLLKFIMDPVQLASKLQQQQASSRYADLTIVTMQ